MTIETSAALREQLAAIEHTRWADWQRYMHGMGTRHPDGSLTIPAELVARWERQIATPYADLSEGEKASDREQVDRYWPLIEPLLILDVPATAEIAAIRARHRPIARVEHERTVQVCAACDQGWPCDTDRMLRAYAEAARQAISATDEAARTAAALGEALTERDAAREATRRIEAQMETDWAAQGRRDDEWAGKVLAAAGYDGEPVPREAVRRFAALMEAKLRKHDHDRAGWANADPWELWEALKHHVYKLHNHLRHWDAAAIGPAAADVGNYAMMLADVAAAWTEAGKDGERS